MIALTSESQSDVCVGVVPAECLPFSCRQKKQLRDKIGKLSQTEHEEIYKILKRQRISFTQNKNGIFFDFSLIDSEVSQVIEGFVDFCISNKVELDEYDKQINECKINNSFDKMKVSVPLTKVITSEHCDKVDDWQGLLNEVKTNEKINAFVNLLENNSEKMTLRKTNTKFINAKKKYSKRITSDKKNESELQSNLVCENYNI